MPVEEEIQTLFRTCSRERLLRSRNWLVEHEAQFLAAIARGKDVNPSRIEPILCPVRTREERDLFRFARFTSSLPFSDRVGRRLKFLIRDASLPNCPLMGIAALGSPVLDLRPRDIWVYGNLEGDRGQRHRQLGSLLELYVAVGIRPYADLLAGKLVCYCMATKEIAETYLRRYGRKDPPTTRRRLHDKCLRSQKFPVQPTGL